MPTEPSPNPAERVPLPVVVLDATPPGAAPGTTATAEIGMTMGGQPLRLRLTVPSGPARPRDLLPIVQGLTNMVVGDAVRKVEAEGKSISCQKGCGACCRQLVPISPGEARDIARVVEAMPEPRRSAVRERFAEARRRLDGTGLLEPLRRPTLLVGRHTNEIGLEYFALGIPCPFLEEESCSIHPDRPTACREYLVTSPAEHCARPSGETVRCVPLPSEVSRVLRDLEGPTAESPMGWVPLVLAPEWAETHPEEPPSRPGPALLQEFFARWMKAGKNATGPGHIDGWVSEGNLGPFLTAVSWVCGHDFGAAEWETVRDGVRASDGRADRWSEVALGGKHPGTVRLAREASAGLVRFRADVPPEVEAQVRLAAAIFQRYQIRDEGV